MTAHPLKIRVNDVPSDGSLSSERGWHEMDVKWLVTSETFGADQTVFGMTVFAPGSKHAIHRHPNVEEVEYLVQGRGVARVGQVDVEFEAGELTFVPADVYHGFENTSPTETAVMIWCYAGAANLEHAGYVTLEDDELTAKPS